MKTSIVEKRPTILLFDSGVGGLSVYHEIKQHLPQLNYIYLFDNEAFPYGEKTEEFLIARGVKLIEGIVKRYDIALVVIACNTASTVILPALREKFSFPVVGVVPAIKPAVSLTKNGVVGLLATKGTISRAYTHNLIEEFAQDCQVKLLGSSKLVELAEDKLHGKQINLNEIKEILEPWTSSDIKPDTIVLGCTHFPLLRDELQQVLSEHVQLIDSGEAIARRVASFFDEPLNYNSKQQNIAMCTCKDQSVELLMPVLKSYGFDEITEFSSQKNNK